MFLFPPPSRSPHPAPKLPDRPPKPDLELLRAGGEFSIGETARVRCTAPDAYSGLVLVLSKVQGSGYIKAAVATAAGFSKVLSLRDISGKDQGDYVCMYQIKRSGIWLNSTQSQAVRLRVT
eukprot:g16581.t1